MSYKLCPVCTGTTNYMTGILTQPFDPATEDSQITDFVCPYCGYTETETIDAPATIGVYNSGIGCLMTPVKLENAWGIYNSGIGYKMEPVLYPYPPEPEPEIIAMQSLSNVSSNFDSGIQVNISIQSNSTITSNFVSGLEVIIP